MKKFVIFLPLLVVGSLVLVLLQMKESQDPSAKASSKVRVVRNLTYYTDGGRDLKMDICRLDDLVSEVPGVLLIHGGGWYMGDRLRYEDTCQNLAKRGLVAFNIDYSLAPGYRFPTQIEEAQYALRWIKENSAVYLVDPQKIIVWGESAGGNIAEMVGLSDATNRDMGLKQHSSLPAGVIAEYPVSDLANVDYYHNPQKPNYSEFQEKIFPLYLSKKLSEDARLYENVSPYHQIVKQTVPFLFVHGTNDTLAPIEDSRRMLEKIRAFGGQADLVSYTGGHGFFPANEKNRIFEEQIKFIGKTTMGDKCLFDAKQMTQAVWRGDLGYVRTIPVENQSIVWGSASEWSAPVSASVFPGTGDIRALGNTVYPNAKTLLQSFWRGGEGYVQTIKMGFDGTPDFKSASGFRRVISATSLPGSGDIQAQTVIVYPSGLKMLQSFWRGDLGYSHEVPIRFDGEPMWELAGPWSSPISTSSLPGSGQIQTQTAIVYPDGKSLLIAVHRDNFGYLLDVSIVDGEPDWNRAGKWSAPISPDSLPGNGEVQAHSIFYSDCK